MPEVARIDTLKNQHRQLQAKIEAENSRPLPDEFLVSKLKREKLKVKDQLVQMHAL
ncbi:MAG: hypothetical protein K0Q70_767 [Rhodospirillales bacterium]|jgi:hypothetical protein|nr:hypothetical protein [Rhodospirillales bacterium]